MANSILKLKVESDEYDAKLKRAAEGIRHLADVAHKGGGELTGLEKAEIDYIKALGDMETKSRSAAGQARELENAFKELTVIYNNLNEVEKADEGGKALAASLETLRQRTIDAKSQLDAASQSLKVNEDAGKENSSMLEQLAGKFTVNIDAIKLFNLGLKASKAVLDVAKDAFFNNEENLDEWGRTVESCESVYRGFLNSINTGDISGFLSNIQTITQAARDAYDALDELATFNAFNKANIAGARADLTGSIADFREGKGGKDDVSKASEALIKELQTKQKLQEEAYKKVIAKVAAERGVKESDLMKVMTGNYGTFKELKDLQYTGRKTTMVATGGTFTSGPTYRQVTEAVPANEREKLAQAIKHLNDTEIDNFQSLAEAAKMTEIEINNQRKMVARVLNGKQGGSGSGDTGNNNRKGGGGGRTPAVSKEDLQREKMFAQLRKAEAQASKIIADERAKEHRTETRGTSGFNEQNIANWTSMMKDQLSKADFGSVMYNQIVENMKDMSVITELTKEAVKRGFSPNELGLTDLFEQAFDNIDVDDNAIQGIIDKINEVFKDNPIELNVKTGGKDGIKPISDEVKKLVKTANITADVVGSIGDAFNAIEDPAAKVAGTVAQAIASVALGYAQATTQASSMGPWAWIAFAASGLAQMLTMISTIHSATGYAQGGIVKGNSYSGDNIYGGPDAMVNAGELVLTRAQQANLASNLEGSGGGFRDGQIIATIKGETIVLAAKRWKKRTGRSGENVSFKI